MGNNPFAGCPALAEIHNASPCYVLEDGILYDRAKTIIIHYTAAKPDKHFTIPDSVECVGKHCFFACNNLERITIPSSVIRFENNPFSGCERLTIDNNSPHYIIERGVIYNKFKTTIVGALNCMEIGELILPETVTLISRNSFWNCKKIKKIIITKNVRCIGYNPFAGCEVLTIERLNPNYPIRNGMMTNRDGTEILCCPNEIARHGVTIPDGARIINRGAFSGCKDLKEIAFDGIEIIDKSAFTNCTGLRSITIPDSVKHIGEWAFSYCTNLERISVGEWTTIDRNAFNECPVEVEIRR
jgi:hypothetical protein